MSLIKDFEKLPFSNGSHDHAYSAVPISGFESHKLAKDNFGRACLLISTVNNPTNKPDFKQQLYNLMIEHNVQCEVVYNDKKSIQSFSIIKYLGDEKEVQIYFLKVCEIILDSIGKNPDKSKIKSAFNKFIDLFKALNEPPKRSLQGLWAELFLINQSKNIKLLVESWHAVPEEIYDFSSSKFRIEVKSSSRRLRSHHFSLQQLTPPKDSNLYIASVFVEQLSGGKSIQNLIDSIQYRLEGNHKLVQKVFLISSAILGSDINKITEVCFDDKLAKESLLFFKSSDVPKIENIPPQIYDIKFICNLSSVQSTNLNI